MCTSKRASYATTFILWEDMTGRVVGETTRDLCETTYLGPETDMSGEIIDRWSRKAIDSYSQ